MNSICLFGDSLAKGVILDEEKGKYTFCDNGFVNILSEKTKYSIKNYSKFGCTLVKGIGIMQKHIEDIDKADRTVLEFGGNDCDFVWAEVSSRPDDEHLPKTPISEFCKEYYEVIENLKKENARTILLNLPPLDASRYLNWISKGLSKENILKWLGGSCEYIYRWHEMYNMKICEIASKLNVPVIDIRSAFLEKRNYSDYLCADGIHPNEMGHKLIFDAIISSGAM